LKLHGKLIGFFAESEKGLVLIMPRTSKHLFRLYQSYGISTAVLDELVTTPAIIGMRVIVDNGKQVLVTTPSKWKRLGIEYRCKGYENQTHLRISDFDLVVG